MTHESGFDSEAPQTSSEKEAVDPAVDRTSSDLRSATTRLGELMGEPWLFPPIVVGNSTIYPFGRHDFAVDTDMGIRVGLPMGTITVEGQNTEVDWRWITVPGSEENASGYVCDRSPWSTALMKRPAYEQAAVVESVFDTDGQPGGGYLGFALPTWLTPFYDELNAVVDSESATFPWLRREDIASTHLPVVGPVELAVFTTADRIATRVEELGLAPSPHSVLSDLPESSGVETEGADIDGALRELATPDWVVRIFGLCDQGSVDLSVSIVATDDGASWTGFSQVDNSVILSRSVNPATLIQSVIAALGTDIPEQPQLSASATPTEVALLSAVGDVFRVDGPDAVFSTLGDIERSLSTEHANSAVAALHSIAGRPEPGSLSEVDPVYLLGIHEGHLAASGIATALIKMLSEVRTYVTIAIEDVGEGAARSSVTVVRSDLGQLAVGGDPVVNGSVDIVSIGNASLGSLLMEFIGAPGPSAN